MSLAAGDVVEEGWPPDGRFMVLTFAVDCVFVYCGGCVVVDVYLCFFVFVVVVVVVVISLTVYRDLMCIL